MPWCQIRASDSYTLRFATAFLWFPVPGASAFVAALAASGLPVDKFRFWDSAEQKGERKKALEELKDAPGRWFSTRLRIAWWKCSRDAREILGEREIVIAREVTKVHEEFLRGTIGTALEYLKKKPVKGEITVLIGLHAVPEAKDAAKPAASILSEIQAVMAERKVDERAALKIVARARGVSRAMPTAYCKRKRTAKK